MHYRIRFRHCIEPVLLCFSLTSMSLQAGRMERGEIVIRVLNQLRYCLLSVAIAREHGGLMLMFDLYTASQRPAFLC